MVPSLLIKISCTRKTGLKNKKKISVKRIKGIARNRIIFLWGDENAREDCFQNWSVFFFFRVYIFFGARSKKWFFFGENRDFLFLLKMRAVSYLFFFYFLNNTIDLREIFPRSIIAKSYSRNFQKIYLFCQQMVNIMGIIR